MADGSNPFFAPIAFEFERPGDDNHDRHELEPVKQEAQQGVPSITKAPFGTANGEAVDLYTLRNEAGMAVQIMTYGATITQLLLPDCRGRSANVVLGFPTLEDYVAKNSRFLADGQKATPGDRAERFHETAVGPATGPA